MRSRHLRTIAHKEIRGSLRNRWFLLFGGAFAVLALALSYLSVSASGFGGFAGFGRTTASLVNMILLIVPLMGLTVGAGSLAGERERGTLVYLLAQPLSRSEILFGKYGGLAISLGGALGIGFGISALVLATSGGGAGLDAYVTLVVLSLMLALAMLSIGMLISTVSPSASTATGVALVSWLGLAFLSDLGLMGSALAFRLPVTDLFYLTLLHPLQVFKMAVLHSVTDALNILGPVGTYATQTHANALLPMFAVSLSAWILLPLAAARALFVRKNLF